MALVAWVLWRLRHSMPPGGVFALWLVLAGTERFLVEFVRRNDTVFVGLTMPQLLSLAMMVGGGIFLAWVLRGGSRVPAPAS